MEDKVINLLHMARKARKLKSGYDACERSCFSNNAKLLIYASDLSERGKITSCRRRLPGRTGGRGKAALEDGALHGEHGGYPDIREFGEATEW